MKQLDNIFNYLPQIENTEVEAKNIQSEYIETEAKFIEINVIDLRHRCEICEQNDRVYIDDEEECVSNCETKNITTTYTFLHNENLSHFLWMLKLNDDYPLNNYEQKKLFMILKQTTLSEYLSEGEIDYTKDFSMSRQEAYDRIKINEEINKDLDKFFDKFFPNRQPLKKISVEDFICQEEKKYNEIKKNNAAYYEQIMKGLESLVPQKNPNENKEKYDITLYPRSTYIS